MPATRSMAGAARGARPRFVWRMTPLALMTGSSDGRKASPSRLPADASIQAMTDGSVDNAASPPAIAPRTSAAAARRALTVASTPKRASSARTAGRCLNCSIDGINLKSDMTGLQDCRIAGIAELQEGKGGGHPAILQYYVIAPHDFGSAKIPSARTLLAVRRSAGAADRCGAGLARSGPARGALRSAAAAVFDHAGVSGARRPGVLDRDRSRARVGGVRRNGHGHPSSVSRAVLVERRLEAARSLSDCRRLGRDRGPHRRPSRAVRPRAVAAAGLVAHPALACRGPFHHRTRSAAARGGAEAARGGIQHVFFGAAAQAALGDARPGGGPRQAVRPWR